MRYLIIFFIILAGCSSNQEETGSAEYIYRLDHEKSILPLLPLKRQIAYTYPWNEAGSSQVRRITKEYFRCKGNGGNEPKIVTENNQKKARLTDCAGGQKHGLPLRNNKEFIYPILLELLNHIQDVTKKQVIITSGHRCPQHNSYMDHSPQNSTSKHLLGAEVSFYILGLEKRPEVALKIIQDFYKTHARYQKQPDYQEFKRFTTSSQNQNAPWHNKEVLIKIYNAQEGRNYDNRHNYPYINLQVRFDRERNLAVNFNLEQANAFLRQ